MDNRDPQDQNRIWEVVGKLDGRIGSVEASQYQNQQAIVNHRAETNGHLKDMENNIERWMKDVMGKLSIISRFQYLILGGGTAVMFIIMYLDKIKGFFA